MGHTVNKGLTRDQVETLKVGKERYNDICAKLGKEKWVILIFCCVMTREWLTFIQIWYWNLFACLKIDKLDKEMLNSLNKKAQFVKDSKKIVDKNVNTIRAFIDGILKEYKNGMYTIVHAYFSVWNFPIQNTKESKFMLYNNRKWRLWIWAKN